MIKRVGILGGTFDPIHLGHLDMAHCVLHYFPEAFIHFIPCFQPAHREMPFFTVEQRLEMVRLTLQNEKHCIVDDREIRRGGVSYMVDTLQSLRREYPNTQLLLILGYDAWQYFDRWKDWKTILDLAHIIVLNRPDYQTQPLSKNLEMLWQERKVDEVSVLDTSLSGKIFYISEFYRDISATYIRDMLNQEKNVAKWLSSDVQQYLLSYC